jgi:hypothetical protein
VATSYTDAKIHMCNEFNSPSRQQRTLQMVSSLKLECAAKDETSVDIMCRKCYSTFHRRLQQVDAVIQESNFDTFQ